MFGAGHLNEVLLHLDDEEMSYSYYIANPSCPGCATSAARACGA
jgi:hypothetical protein